MKIRGALIVLFILGLFVLASCETSTLRGERYVDGEDESLEPVSDDLVDASCAAITCPTGTECVNGECGCADGEQLCGDTCISPDSCCSTDDCSNGQTCEDNECVDSFSCEGLVCDSNQVCSESFGGCTCPGGYKWCERQEKCIPNDHCCSRFDCGSNERCIDTITSAELCLEGKGKACKIFDTTGLKELSLPSATYTLNVTRVNYVDDVHVDIDNNTYILVPESPVNIGGGNTLSIQKLRETGGHCRDFDRDT